MTNQKPELTNENRRRRKRGIERKPMSYPIETVIDMLLFCPRCSVQHVDQPQPEKDWTNPPHRSHECQSCGHVWRPADVATNGVAEIQTKGQRDGSANPRDSWHRETAAARPDCGHPFRAGRREDA